MHTILREFVHLSMHFCEHTHTHINAETSLMGAAISYSSKLKARLGCGGYGVHACA